MPPRPQPDVFSRFATGNSMNLAGIQDGDRLVFKRLHPRHGDIVLAHIAHEGRTVKRLRRIGTRLYLYPESSDPQHTAILLESEDAIEGVLVWPDVGQGRAHHKPPRVRLTEPLVRRATEEEWRDERPRTPPPPPPRSTRPRPRLLSSPYDEPSPHPGPMAPIEEPYWPPLVAMPNRRSRGSARTPVREVCLRPGAPPPPPLPEDVFNAPGGTVTAQRLNAFVHDPVAAAEMVAAYRAWERAWVVKPRRFPQYPFDRPVPRCCPSQARAWLPYAGEVGCYAPIDPAGPLAWVSAGPAAHADFWVWQSGEGMALRGVRDGDVLFVKRLQPEAFFPGLVVIVDLGDWGASCAVLGYDEGRWYARSASGRSREMNVEIVLEDVLGLVFQAEGP